MKNTAEESADLKQALKHDPCTPELEDEAERFPAEAGEALYEVETGLDECSPESWVARELQRGEARGEYIPPEDCVASGSHLTDCDDDGYCNLCGES